MQVEGEPFKTNQLKNLLFIYCAINWYKKPYPNSGFFRTKISEGYCLDNFYLDP